MIQLAIMIEGQDGLTWPRWMRLAKAVEELGFAGLYRSDHYTNANPPDKDSLELWVSLTWLASNTNRIEFGPLVSPFSFRHPTILARMAAAVDDLSNGRLTLGLGAGWQEREHTNFGLDLMDLKHRFARFREGLDVVQRLLESDVPVQYEGVYYQLRDAILLPRPARPGGPPILIGGNGKDRTLPLVAQYAKEWNGVFIPPSRVMDCNQRLNMLLAERGRQPSDLRRSLMTGCAFGKDEARYRQKLEKLGWENHNETELLARGLVFGTPSQVVEQLGRFAEAGLQRVMLQWMDQDDIDGLADLAATVLPQVS